MSLHSAVGVFHRFHQLSLSRFAILAASLGVGWALFAASLSRQTLITCVLGIPGISVLLIYPELALALYVVIGDLKGDERVASIFPIDLTLALGAIILVGIALNSFRRKRTVRMPAAFLLYIALIALMVASLAYTPVFDAGLEKLGRFLTVTGLVIVAPFFILTTPQALKRFFAGFAIITFLICAYSLTQLGGSDRLVTPSSNTIGLGHVACSLILLLWFICMPRLSFFKRMLVYPLLAVPLMALIGSGSRGAAIALGMAILASLFLYRQFAADLACLIVLGFAAIPFLSIPEASFEYLGTLANSRSMNNLLNFRAELLGYGWHLLQQHPLIGVGIQGFRYHSPNAGLYNWPHNIFLELACELGIPAMLIVCSVFGSAIRESARQVRDEISPYVTFSYLAAALLLVGFVNSLNTGDINSDRSTWLFISLVFVVGGLRIRAAKSPEVSTPCSARTSL
jgi:O-antigen ligase